MFYGLPLWVSLCWQRLLVRLGLSHFRREYLLGREIDTLNFKLIGRTFRDRFKGQATSVSEWYRTELPLTLKQLRQPLMIVCGLAIIAGIASYMWVIVKCACLYGSYA